METESPNQCILLIHMILGAKSGMVNAVVTVPCPTSLLTTRPGTGADRHIPATINPNAAVGYRVVPCRAPTLGTMASNRGHLRVVIFVLLRGVIFGVLDHAQGSHLQKN